MAQPKMVLSLDDEVTPQVLAIIKEAKKYAVIVTPYVDLWGHAEDAIRLAVKNGVKVVAIVRGDPEVIDSPGVAWLADNGVDVLAVDKLHAKIYLNEQDLVLSSMNLIKSSAHSSHEIAWYVQDEDVGRDVRGYVKNTLQRLAKPIKTSTAKGSRVPVGEASRQERRAAEGRCIRCGQPILLDPDKPLCESCYDVWSQYGDKEYPEKLCHVCGRPAEVSYARPLCRECFRVHG
ncbi:MAG: hypothetical protein HY671_12810 [Chloroflexi bacterium]|nr:hypothetical protein [Chloroflexota bacterium]